MTPLVKALLAVALVIPLVAYVAGTLASSGGGAPEQQGTVYLDDVEPATDATTPTPDQDRQKPPRPSPEPSVPPSPSESGDDRPAPERQGTDDGEARVVTPAPVGSDDDDDDDDERDDGRDDTDDGDTDD